MADIIPINIDGAPLALAWVKGEQEPPAHISALVKRHASEIAAFHHASAEIGKAQELVASLAAELTRREATTNMLAEMLEQEAQQYMIENAEKEEAQK